VIRPAICNELFEGWPLARVCEVVKKLGYEGLEIAPFTLAARITDFTASQRREARATIVDSGLKTVGLHWLLAKTEGFHLTSPDASMRRRTADYLIALAEATADLGGTLMVLGSPKQRDLMPGVSTEQALDYAAEVLGAILAALDASEVDLCLEPLGPAETNFLNSLAEADTLRSMLEHPRVKLHLDVKAMSTDPGGTIPELIRLYGPEAGHLHVQDPTTLQGPGMGPLDFGPILKAVAASGYAGWTSVEVFDFTPGAEAIASASIDALRGRTG